MLLAVFSIAVNDLSGSTLQQAMQCTSTAIQHVDHQTQSIHSLDYSAFETLFLWKIQTQLGPLHFLHAGWIFIAIFLNQKLWSMNWYKNNDQTAIYSVNSFPANSKIWKSWYTHQFGIVWLKYFSSWLGLIWWSDFWTRPTLYMPTFDDHHASQAQWSIHLWA